MIEKKKEDLYGQENCEAIWKQTLEHFNIERPILPHEKMAIARLISSYDWKSVAYALTGMRYEAKSSTYDPKNYVGLRRLDDPILFERFINLACQRKKKSA